MRIALSALLFTTPWLFAPAPPAHGAQEEEATPNPETIRAERALVCVDRKSAGDGVIGLYLREESGKMVRIWDGEPYDAHALLDHSILIVERWDGRITWLDGQGKVRFQKGGFERPVDVERAPDGTLVVVENDQNCVIGLDPKTGEQRWVRRGFVDPFDVSFLQDGGMLVADSGNDRIVALDPEGKVRWHSEPIDFPNTVDALDDGGALVTNWTGGEVIELAPDGKIRWRVRVGGTLYRAERRWDGLTLVCDGASGRLLFLSPRGRVLKVERFEPGCVDYETIQEL